MDELTELQSLYLIIVGIFISLNLYCAIRYIKLARTKENREEKILLLGFGIYFLISPIARIFHDVYPSIKILDDAVGHYIMIISYIISIIYVESSIKRTKHVFSLLLIMLGLLNLLGILHIFITMLVSVLMYIILFFYMVMVSNKEFQNIGLFMIMGILITLIAMFMETPGIIEGEFKYTIARIINIIAIVFIILPTYFSTSFLSSIKPNFFYIFFILWDVAWTIIGIILLIIDAYILRGSSFNLVVYLGSLNQLPLILAILLYRKNRKLAQAEALESKIKPERQDFLTIFSKPEKLTEEEVSVAKEKGVCLVCKNEISRQNYVCPRCKSLYCIKCSSTLAGMENACWVCETPFDESKPTKKAIIQEDESPILINEHKNRNPK